MKRLLLFMFLLALLACGFDALAQPLALPPPPQAGIEPVLGARLPLDLSLTDESGRAMRLGNLFGVRPVLLVPGYYTCPELCGLLMHALLEGVHASGLEPADVRIVRVSIDPQDGPAAAAAQRLRDLDYAAFLTGEQREAPPDLHLLVGARANTSMLAETIGYRFEATPSDDSKKASTARYAHPAVVIVATPDGRVSRYLTGIRFEPARLRSAVQDAAQGRIGTFSDRLALLCAHFDPRLGRYSEPVMNTLRAVGLLTVLGLGGWCWRRRGAPGRAPS